MKEKLETGPNVSFLKWVSRAVPLNVKKRLISKKGFHYSENLKNLQNFFLVVWKLAQMYFGIG